MAGADPALLALRIMSTTLDIVRIPVLSDNYVWLMREPQSGAVAVVDPAVAGPVLAEAEKRRWKITHILNTHHHGDHVGGNLEIKKATGCTIVGPRQRPGAHPRHRRRGRRRRPLPVRRGRGRDLLRAGPHAAATSPMRSATRRRCSAATRCSRWAAAGCSRARRSSSGRRSAACARCPTTCASTAPTNTPSRTPALR